MSRSNNPISDIDPLDVAMSKHLTYDVFAKLRVDIIASLTKTELQAHARLLLDFGEATYEDLEARKVLIKAWPNMDANAKQEALRLCKLTQDGATPEEGTPGPAGVREVTEAMGDIAIDSGPQKPTVTSMRAKSVISGHCRLKTEPNRDYELEAEKARLAQEVCARIKKESLGIMLKLMGCDGDYCKFIKEHEAEVEELMKFLPKKLAGRNEEEQQAACMPFLERLVNMANEIWRPKDPTPVSPRQYYLYDTHKNPPEGTRLKPDALVSTDIDERLDTAELIVEFKQNEDKGDVTAKSTQSIYGQLGIYARRVWARQPMRRFVPVLLVHGLRVALFLFTRSKVYRIKIGSAIAGHGSNKTVVGHLLFLLSGKVSNFGVVLPPMSNNYWAALLSSPCQGLFCQRLGVKIDYKEQIKQQRQQQSTSPRPDNRPTTSHFEVNNVVNMSQPDLFGRIAFLAYGTFVDSNGKRTKAVLKFVRREAVRQAEGEAYGVLDWKEVPHVPKLLLSGYADEWGSGVLECLVVADAGQSLREYRAGDVDARRDPKLLERVAKVVTRCLWDASQAGVYHRDISIGNIYVDAGGTVRVIDWGCARVEPETLEAYRKWLMGELPGNPSLSSLPAADKVADEEKRHDPFTGTSYFLSIRVLLRREYRCVVDDIESLLYVLVYFVAKDRDAFKNAPLCRKGLTEEEQALKKAAAFMNIGKFYTWTGLGDLEAPCLGFLRKLARRLFIDKVKGTSIMNQLLNDEKDPRESYDLEHWLIKLPQKATSPNSRGGPHQPQAPAIEADK